MPNTKRHMFEGRNRSFYGEQMAQLLICWLNSTRGTVRNRRITALIGLMREFLDFAEKHKKPRWSESELKELGLKHNIEDIGLPWDGRLIFGDNQFPNAGFALPLNSLGAKLRKAFLRYSVSPELFMVRGGRFLFAWRSANQEKRDRIYAYGDVNDCNLFGEADAVCRIIEMSHDGYFDRLKLCRCDKWFFAKFSHQRFCSVKCQQSEYRSDPEFRERRRRYFKELRQLHKEKLFGQAQRTRPQGG